MLPESLHQGTMVVTSIQTGLGVLLLGGLVLGRRG